MSDWTGTATPPSSTATGAYVTVAEVATYFGADPRATAFLALSSAEQAAYLVRATRTIDSMVLRGAKYDSDQALEFPRIIDGVIVGDADQADVVPQAVLDACCEEALAIFQAGSSGGRQALQAQGVASYNIPGIISESFVAGFGSVTLQSPRARQIMRRYMGAEVR